MATATKTKKKPAKMSVKLQPLGDRVVVEREEAEEITSGGIVLPDSARNKPSRGTILAIGDGKLLDDGSRGSMQVKVGDRVLFSSYAPQEIRIGDDTVLLMSESDVMAVLEG
jgi:chaperonin GroES